MKYGSKAYLNEEGIYPKYPCSATEKLYIVPSPLDAATLLESRLLKKEEAVMSLFEGKIKNQHIEAIKTLKQLKQIVWIDYTTKTEQLLFKNKKTKK